MAVNTIEVSGNLAADTNLHPSRAIWADCPINTLKEDPTFGFWMHEDFQKFGKSTAVASNVGRYVGDDGNIWVSFEDTSCTFTNPVESPVTAAGIGRASLVGTAHKAVVMELGPGTAYSSGSAGQLLYTDALGGKLWFEARILFHQIAASTNIAFMGIAQSGCAIAPAAATSTTTLFDVADGIGQVDLLGFDVLQAAPSTLRAVYGKNAANRTSAGNVQTLVADTWYKVGFTVDPLAPYTAPSGASFARKKVRWFINGTEQKYLSDTLTGPFPTGNVMVPVFHYQNGGTTTPYMEIDYIRCAQLYTS